MTCLPGVFRIVSWNMQGAAGTDIGTGKIKDKLSVLQAYMQDEQVIAICLQECSDLYGWWPGEKDRKEQAEFLSKETSAERAEKQAATKEKLSAQFKLIGKTEDFLKLDERWADPIFFYDKYGRCSLGILVRKLYYAGQEIKTLDYRRPIMGVRLHGFNRRQPLYLFSIHVPYNKNNPDPNYIQNLLEYASSDKFLRPGGEEGNWIGVGDFNHPADKQEENAFKFFAPNMRRPGIPTTKGATGNEYDYCFVGGEYLLSRGCSVHVHQVKYSDHNPVHFLFSPRGDITKHASDLASKLTHLSENATSKPVWRLYNNNKLFPKGVQQRQYTQ